MGIYNVHINAVLSETYTYIAESEEQAKEMATDELKNAIPSFSLESDFNTQTEASDISPVFPATSKVYEKGIFKGKKVFADLQELTDFIQSRDCKNGISSEKSDGTIYIYGADSVIVLTRL
jgi:hypothetical protein